MGMFKDIFDVGKDLWYSVKKPVPQPSQASPEEIARKTSFMKDKIAPLIARAATEGNVAAQALMDNPTLVRLAGDEYDPSKIVSSDSGVIDKAQSWIMKNKVLAGIAGAIGLFFIYKLVVKR